MAVTRGTLRIARHLRRDIGAEVDGAVRTLTGEWVDAWDGLAPAWQGAADELVAAAVRLERWPHPGEIMRMGDVDRAMRGSIAALDKLAERTETVAREGADRVIQLDVEREARIIASQAPAAEEPALARMLADRLGVQQLEALREAWVLREQARDDVRLTVNTRIRTDAVNVITRRTGEQIHSSRIPLSPQAVDAMGRELIAGIDVGRNPREAAARMVANTEGAFNGGLDRAMVISRTEMLDAYRATSHQIHMANADIVPAWSWLAELDSRICPSCLSLHGTEYPASVPGPDDHPQGRCARLPVLASWAELGISAPEPPSALPDAEEWFARLPRATQLQIMGPGRLQLLRDGRVGWGDLSTTRHSPGWRPSRVPTPVRDLRRRADRGLAATPRPVPPARTGVQPAPAPAATPTFDLRLATARSGGDALRSAPVNLVARNVPKNSPKWLTKTERSDLNAYKGAGYTAINSVLRRPGGLGAVRNIPAYGDLTKRVRRLDKVMDRSTLSDDVVVYRGVQAGPTVFGPDIWSRNMAGVEWTESAFVSTSVKERLAERFGANAGGAVLRIIAPKGTRAVTLSGISGEAEMLLARGTRLRVVRDSGPGTRPRRLDVEVVPARTGAQATTAARSVRQAGRDLTDDITRSTYRALAERAGADRGFGNPVLTELTRLQPGWHNPGRVVSGAQLDEAIEQGWTQLFRGVQGSGTASAARVAEESRVGDWRMGHGVYGDGVYTSTRRTTAEAFRGSRFDGGTDRWGVGDNEWIGGFTPRDRGGLMRMAVDPDARLADYHTLVDEWRQWQAGQRDEPWFNESYDLGWFAVLRGYDGIRIRGRPGIDDGAPYPLSVQGLAEADQYVIYNRSVLMFEEASSRYDS